MGLLRQIYWLFSCLCLVQNVQAAEPVRGVGITGSADRLPAVGNESVNKTISLIRRQVVLEKNKNKTMLESTADRALTSANKQTALIDTRLEADIAKFLENNPVTVRNAQDQNFLQWREYEVEQMRNRAKDEQSMLVRGAKEKASSYNRVADMRSAALDQVADNLERQLAEKPGSSAVRLLPVGTDLYVRNYASASAAQVLPVARGAVAGPYGRRTSLNPPDLDKADVRFDSRRVSASVRGKLLK